MKDLRSLQTNRIMYTPMYFRTSSSALTLYCTRALFPSPFTFLLAHTHFHTSWRDFRPPLSMHCGPRKSTVIIVFNRYPDSPISISLTTAIEEKKTTTKNSFERSSEISLYLRKIGKTFFRRKSATGYGYSA